MHPREKYVAVKASNGETYILAEALCENTMKAGGDAIASVALGKASKKLKKIAKEEEQRKNEEI